MAHEQKGDREVKKRKREKGGAVGDKAGARRSRATADGRERRRDLARRKWKAATQPAGRPVGRHQPGHEWRSTVVTATPASTNEDLTTKNWCRYRMGSSSPFGDF